MLAKLTGVRIHVGPYHMRNDSVRFSQSLRPRGHVSVVARLPACPRCSAQCTTMKCVSLEEMDKSYTTCITDMFNEGIV